MRAWVQWAETLEPHAKILLWTLQLIAIQLWREPVLTTKQENRVEEKKGTWAVGRGVRELGEPGLYSKCFYLQSHLPDPRSFHSEQEPHFDFAGRPSPVQLLLLKP